MEEQYISPMTNIKKELVDLLSKTVRISLELYKVMIPVLILVKLLEMAGGITLLARALSPVMGIVGLPGETALVWATAMLVNLYAAIIVLAGLALQLTAAQATVLALMMLVAHNLLVETAICTRAGLKSWFMLLSRIAGAFLFGYIMHITYSSTGTLQYPVQLLWSPPAEAAGGLISWGVQQVKNLLSISVIIFLLVSMMRFLAVSGAEKVLAHLFSPFLKITGIGRSATTITIIGVMMGLAYGGGLIIEEARSGAVPQRDLLSSITLMGLCHSLVEDTMLMLLIGGHLTGTLLGRALLSMLAVAVLVRMTATIADNRFRILFTK